MAFCSKCGAPAIENAKFCAGCGTPLEVAPVAEPVVEPVAEPVVEPVAEPVVEPIVEPAEEPIAEPMVEPVSEPVAEPIVEPVAEPAEEPVAEPVVEPVPEPVEEPIEEPVKPVAVPEKCCTAKAISTLYYIGFTLLYSLPVIGLVATIVMSLGVSKNESKQNFAKAFLVFKIIGLVLLLAAGIAVLVLNKEILEMINDILGENYREWEQLFDAYEWE